jgi:hypothetical protein
MSESFMKTDQDHWTEQRILARAVRESVAAYAQSKYDEYRWVRGCTHAAASREARTQTETLVTQAAQDASGAVQLSEMARTRR